MVTKLTCEDILHEKLNRLVIKRIPSRRNLVYLIQGNLIVKKFVSSKNAKKEFDLLNRIRELDINAPKPILLCDNILVLSYVGENDLGVILDKIPQDKRTRIFQKIGEIIGKIHSKLNISLQDVNLRNFIINNINNEELYIVDVEDYVEGANVEETLGDLASSIFHFNFRVSMEERMEWLLALLNGVKKYLESINIKDVLKNGLKRIDEKNRLHPELSDKFNETQKILVRVFRNLFKLN